MIPITHNIINCTPHDVNVYDDGKNLIATYPRSQYAPRLGQEPQQQVGYLTTENGATIPVYSPQKFGDVEGLPPCENGNCPDIIVSMLVGQKLQESGAWTGGVFGPDTGKGVVRNQRNQVVDPILRPQEFKPVIQREAYNTTKRKKLRKIKIIKKHIKSISIRIIVVIHVKLRCETMP